MTIWSGAAIVTNPDLSLWKAQGLTLPADIINFREQLVDGKVATVIYWRPEKKEETAKAAGEL